MDNYHLNYDINKVIKDRQHFLFGCDYYTALEYPEINSALLLFKC